jgi:hypothetical protein
MANVRLKSRLTFIKKTVNQVSKNGRILIRSKALYLCECGNSKEIDIQNVKRGHTSSCGCYAKEDKSNRAKHRLISHPLYSIWIAVKNRCYNPNTKDWSNYGGRGVHVCGEWVNNFICFYNWALSNGWEKGLYIDKDIKAKELGVEALLYSPERCMFVTPKVSSNNVRSNRVLEFKGKQQNLSQWAEEFKINRCTLRDRLKAGWTIRDALTKPLRDINAPRK